MGTIIPVYQPECQKKSWKTYLKEAISDPQQLLAQLNLSAEQLELPIDLNNPFPVRVPKPFIDKMKLADPKDPLLLQVISQLVENEEASGFELDPLQEVSTETPGLLHKYHGRVLLILASACAINCRYCFRRHFPYQDQLASGEELEASLGYIAANDSITEVILSGGDPLIVGDNFLKNLVAKIDNMSHIKRLRIHTRLPVVIPQRLTDELCNLLKNSRLDISMVLHINHPNEIDQLLIDHLAPLSESKVQLLNQSVLLKGINDNVEVLALLSEKLFSSAILPYYIHQLDRVKGAAHFEVPDSKAIPLMGSLRALLPGYLVPRLARETAGKSEKTIIF